jgi:hypothetical protein
MAETRVKDERDRRLEELERENQRLRDQQRQQGRTGAEGGRSAVDPVTATMVQELMDKADYLLASNRQHDPRQTDLAVMLYREISRVQNLPQTEQAKARQRYASALLNQTGWPADASDVFEELIRDRDPRGEDVVPHAINLLAAAHLAVRQDDTRGRDARRKVEEAAHLLGANNQYHEVGWAQVIKGVIALSDGNIPDATARVANGIRLMEQYQPTQPGLGAVSEPRTSPREQVGQITE